MRGEWVSASPARTDSGSSRYIQHERSSHRSVKGREGTGSEGYGRERREKERKGAGVRSEWVSVSPARTDSDSSGYITMSVSPARTASDRCQNYVSFRVGLRSLARLLSSPESA